MDKRVIWSVIGASILVIVGGIYFAGRSNPTPSSNTDTNAPIAKELTVQSSDWTIGKADAPVTLLEYGDFQCPSCGAYHPLVKQLIKDFPDRVRFVYRNYPLVRIHPHAWGAAKAAEAAGKQNKYWEMHDLIYDKQADWEKTTDETKQFSDYANSLGLNVDQFKKDFASTEVENKVHNDQTTGDALNVNGTPTFYVNGRMIDLPGSYEEFKSVIQNAKEAPTPTKAQSEKVHEHADFALFINNKKINISDKKYDEKNPDIHIHDGNGEIVHKHKSDATLAMFYDSLGLNLPSPTEVYVNGKKYEGDWKQYSFKDLDRVVLTNKDLGAKELAMASDKACIYSEKCPERGKPPTETCVGGLGTDCTK